VKFIQETLKLSSYFTDIQDETASSVARVKHKLIHSIQKQFRKEVDNMREKIWVIEQLTIEPFLKKGIYWKDLFREC
jgi:dynein heavy chain